MFQERINVITTEKDRYLKELWGSSTLFLEIEVVVGAFGHHNSLVEMVKFLV